MKQLASVFKTDQVCDQSINIKDSSNLFKIISKSGNSNIRS